MTANVAGSSGAPDSTFGQSRRPAAEPHSAPAAAPEPAPPGPSDLMLTIEPDGRGGFVYVTIDRRTGQVVRRLDRAALMKLRETAGYAAGAVLSTRA
jgi:flagellar protein FlaG